MNFDEFVGAVQNRARFGSMGDAVKSIRCTLGTLSQRLKGGEPKDLASQLPEEIGWYLLHSHAGEGQDFTADEFLDRISSCEGKDKTEAAYHARVVLNVLRDAVSTGQFRHVLDQLPQEFHALFSAEGQAETTRKPSGARRRPANRRATPATRQARAKQTRGRFVRRIATEAQPRSKRTRGTPAETWSVGR